MIDADDLLSLVRNYNPKTNEALIRGAYDYARRMHEGQKRHSGEPYFTHPVAVAAILTEQRLDDATIITALLHDTIEDTKGTYSEIAEEFGTDVAELVDGVTKLTNLELSSRETKQAENFRKLFMAMSKDLRVILVKLADRLHNMRTIRHMPPEKQAKKARDDGHLRAACRPDGHAVDARRARGPVLPRAQPRCARLDHPPLHHAAEGNRRRHPEDHRRHRGSWKRHGVEADVFGRAKKPFSIWRKMQEKQLAFSRLSDIYGFRVITQTEDDCYRVLGAIHQRWRAVPGRFKDYISQPKSNGYRSIHTTVSGRDGKRVEVQIRTRQMHEVAEAGVAAHWSYRDGVRTENPFAVDPAAGSKA
jgi:guanosine-3',5'-bis(diphosphate) 3'-pyrophosphohydrolase